MRCWRLRRNCSLTPRQALAAWSLPVAALLLVAVFAALQGWGWVVAFALLDIAVLALALAHYSRHALDGDLLRLGDDGLLHIEQHCGRRRVCTAVPAVSVRLHPGPGGLLVLQAGRARLRLGAQATPAQRARVARELRHALGLDSHRGPVASWGAPGGLQAPRA